MKSMREIQIETEKARHEFLAEYKDLTREVQVINKAQNFSTLRKIWRRTLRRFHSDT